MADSVEDFERVSAELDEYHARTERCAKIMLICVIATTIAGLTGFYVSLQPRGWAGGLIFFPVLLLGTWVAFLWGRVILYRGRVDQAERHDFLKELRG